MLRVFFVVEGVFVRTASVSNYVLSTRSRVVHTRAFIGTVVASQYLFITRCSLVEFMSPWTTATHCCACVHAHVSEYDLVYGLFAHSNGCSANVEIN